MAGALEGVRVADFTHILNGPFCTMLLGQMGAEIIKIEPPVGDRFRRQWMPKDSPVDAYDFMMVNTNKKSVVLDMKTPEGLSLAKQIIAKSDVLVENFALRTMKGFGLDYESLREEFPRLIYASSRGFGDSGPYANLPSNAGVNMAMTGWNTTAWAKSGAHGTRTLGIGDEAGGVSMALGILAALFVRERTGKGQRVEISMQESMLGFMVSTFHELFTGNKVGGADPPMKVADGYYTVRNPDLDDRSWLKLTEAMERPEFREDKRFATEEARNKHRMECAEIFRDWAQRQTRFELWKKLQPVGFLGSPVISIEEVVENEHIKAREAFVELPHPVAGSVKFVAPWIRLHETPTSIDTAPPLLGQHTAEILTGLLGLEDAEVQRLHNKGVVQVRQA
jgi:crotonobetainyl-CoA:carnitine CoA-transferase CaiB-like acyl-CoA transferase